MKSLKEVILYLCEGMPEFPTLSYLDDKYASDEEKAKDAVIGDRMRPIRISNIDAEIANHLSKAEQRKRSLCFYPNGHVLKKDIKEIKWHFVDIDHGDKEEQFKLIMSAPLIPTLVWRGRAGHKLLYRVKEAKWDTTSSESLKESEVLFKNIQQQLIEYFAADEKLLTPNYALRLPFTKNYKYWREEIVEELIVFFDPNNLYSQKELSEAFPIATEKFSVSETVTFEEYPKELKEIIETTLYYFETNDIDYVDRGDRLSFQCPIHNDTHPSAYMFKDSLICFCSSGECDLDKGKPLGWVAKQLGWGVLKTLYDKISSLPGQNYLNIKLNGMTAVKTIPLAVKADDQHIHVNRILSALEIKMASRGIQVDNKTRQVYEGILSIFLSNKKGVMIFPLEPGGGKSTLRDTYLEYMLENDITQAGTIIVVERIDTAKNLAEQMGIYKTFIDNPSYDVPFYSPNKSAYVMENPFTFPKCKKKLTTYEYGVCRGCPHSDSCPIPRKYEDQKKSPVVIMTHARLKMESNSLEKYKHWKNVNGEQYQRNLIIIDEKPPIINVNSLKFNDFDQFLFHVKSMEFGLDTVEFEKCNTVISQLREKIFPMKGGGKLAPLDPMFSFGFASLWYKKYIGDDVELLKRIEYLIREGGLVNINQKREIGITTNSVTPYNFESYNVGILDGTASSDMEYLSLDGGGILDTPRIRCYDNLTFCIDPSQSLSKSKLRNNPELLESIAKNVKVFCEEEKVLVLCYKDSEGYLKEVLKDQLKKGSVQINHYGNVKGSNIYSDCTVLVMVGIPHKTDPYYINKYEAIYGGVMETTTNTISNVRRFKDINIETVKLNDQLVDAIQDILRIKIRNNKNTSPVKVYIPTKDKVFVNLLAEYFEGATIEQWNMDATYPDWYQSLKELFQKLRIGEKILKSQIRDHLGLINDAGKKYFQRLQKDPLFLDLVNSLGIKEFNNRTFISNG